MSVCLQKIRISKGVSRIGITWRMLKDSFGQLKPTIDTRIIHFYFYTLEQISMDKKEAEKNVHLEI